MVKKRKPSTPTIGKIETDVPLPPRKRRTKYPFKDMRAGDSFVVQGVKDNKITSAISSHVRRHGGDFYTSPDSRTGGIRVHKGGD